MLNPQVKHLVGRERYRVEPRWFASLSMTPSRYPGIEPAVELAESRLTV
jgi:hypothetical protein